LSHPGNALRIFILGTRLPKVKLKFYSVKRIEASGTADWQYNTGDITGTVLVF